jgi:hypothetical protein
MIAWLVVLKVARSVSSGGDHQRGSQELNDLCFVSTEPVEALNVTFHLSNNSYCNFGATRFRLKGRPNVLN